ncbi:hypothetical protein LOTGIDRAFT_227376 [Lottia gigantea]|uniref:ADP-ribosylation factor-like protein 16 n=1 Tax=Lottia gigantea TaxID=225164 RepID=V3ZT54_LOTGI|nr:hypothetical protein LOTGIDRAFT_227376 [Lottia gigantea]ESO94628.1 hypothetical protein LOTGIDRAFT_227376 [Lottia gigantea]
MVLLVGPTSSGKTLMLKRLQCHNFTVKGGIENLDNVPSTIPTVGTNMVNVVTGRRTAEITVRELGGTMAPIWQKYYKDSYAIIFMIDISNRFQLSAACIQLLMLMSSPDTNIPIAIVFNKTDSLSIMSRSEIESVLRLDEILETATQKMTVFHVSAKTGKGLDGIVKWISENNIPDRANMEISQ